MIGENRNLLVALEIEIYIYIVFFSCCWMNSKEKSKSIPTILITGFGPFRSVRLNPSWQVAKALQTYLEWTRPVHIVLQQLQVTYDDVTTKVPRFWSEYNPLVNLLE